MGTSVTELRGRASLDDSDYQAGLRRMESTTQESGRALEKANAGSARGIVAIWREVAKEQEKGARAAAKAEEQAARDKARSEQQAAREATKAARDGAREREQAGREAVRAEMQFAREWEAAEREAAAAVAQAHRDAARQAAQSAREAAQAERQALQQARQDFRSAFGNAGRDLTVGVTLPILAVGAASLKAAIDTEEQFNKVERIFGSSAKTVEAWAKTTAGSMAVSQREALATAGSFGNLFDTIGLGHAQAAQMSVRLVQLAADLGSLHHIGTAEALEKIQSGLVGMSRPLREVGVLLTEERVKQEAWRSGLAPAGEELSEQAKVLARYNLILRDSANANGDFARTHDSAANSIKALLAELDDEAAALGKDLIPAVKDAAKTARELLHEWNQLPAPVKKLAIEALAAAAAFGPIILAVERLVTTAKGLAAIPTLIRGISGAAGAGTGGGGVGGAIAAGGGGAAGAAGVAAGAGAVVAGAAITAAALDTTRHLRGEKAAEAAIRKETDLSAEERRALIQEQRIKSVTTDLPWYLKWVPAAGLGPKAPKLTDQEKALVSGVRSRQAAQAAAQAATAGGADDGARPGDGPVPPSARALAQEAARTFEGQLDRARAAALAAPDDEKAQAEAQQMIPVLQRRQQELKKAKDEAGTDAEKLAQLDKESGAVDLQIAELQSRATKERAQNSKHQAEREKQAQGRIRTTRAALLDAQVQAARDSVAGGPEETHAQAEAAAVVPMLLARKQALLQEAQELVPQFDATYQAQEQYTRLEVQAGEVQRQINGLEQDAAKEKLKNAKQAAKDREEAVKAYFGAQQELAKAVVGAQPQERQAAAAVKELVPALEQEQKFVLAELQSGQLSATEYLKEQKGYWEMQGEINHTKERAAQVEKEQLEKSREAQRKAVQEARGLASARTALIEAEVKNFQTAFGGNERQASRYVLPALVSEFKQAYRPLAGETETERLQRLTEGENLGGKILDTARKAGLDPRAVYRDLAALSRDAGAGPQSTSAAKKAPGQNGNTSNVFTFPIVVPPLGQVTPQERRLIHDEVDRRLDELAAMRR